MGACYSKNASGPGSPQYSNSKLPRLKHRDSKRGTRNSQDQAPEAVPLKDSTVHIENTDDVINANGVHNDISIKIDTVSQEISRSSTPDFVPDHLDEKFADRGVAPSDSGIESIVTFHDDTHENNQSFSQKEDLSQKLQRLSRGSCHKCGNFKLDDTALTALLADTYCSCGPRQVGKPSVNPQCQTHGVQKNKRKARAVEYTKFESDQSGANGAVISHVQDNSDLNRSESGLKSTLRHSNSAQKDKSLRISIRSADSLNAAMTLLSSMENSRSEFPEVSDSSAVAPLAHFDSIDAILNASPLENNEKRRSLLSEILDITDSICRCDFYSNEFCCTKDHEHTNNHSPEAKYNTSDSEFCTDTPQKHPNDFSRPKFNSAKELILPAESSQQNCSTFSYHDSAQEKSHSISTAQKCNNTPTKKSGSLPKNVSFATNGKGSQVEVANVSPSKRGLRLTEEYHERSLSEDSSGIFTHPSALESFRVSKESHKRSASLNNNSVMLSDSSSEALDGQTEEDLNSLDLDSVSRVTSLSYNSIRHLTESTEDLVSPMESARRMVLDGVDCMIIPTDIYRQMQADIATLKQQLLCLSTLIQEEAEMLERNQAYGAESSFTFEH